MASKIDPQRDIEKIIKNFLVREGNLLGSERLFVAKSVLLWAAENSKTKDDYKSYLYEVERHLSGDITLYWEDDKIKIRKVNRSKE
jgi:hypothetical protein